MGIYKMYVQCSFFCLPKTLEFVESTYKIELTLAIIMTTPHIRRRQNITIYLFIMKRKFKQRWSTIPQISTKQTITSEYQKRAVDKENIFLDVLVYIVRWLPIFAMSFYILYLHVIKKNTTEICYKQSKHIKIQYNMSQLNHLTCKNYNR